MEKTIEISKKNNVSVGAHPSFNDPENFGRKRLNLPPNEIKKLVIDQINILESTFKAMKMSLGKLKPVPDEALIDGFPLKTQIIPNRGIIRGDETIDVIKAASIIAKVTRDKIMVEYDLKHPSYGFKKHKGYGTKEHMEMLQLYKPCDIHRKTFNPVSVLL